jgi:exonuclease III
LSNVAELLPPGKRWSAWWDRNGNCRFDGVREMSLIDHILVSEGLYGRVQGVDIVHDWFGATCDPGKRVSDHWPLLVDFAL